DHPDKFMFGVNNAVFDFSDLRTDNVKFPKYYHDQNLLQPSVESWRGVYVQSLDIALPKEFKTEESITQNKRVSFQAMDMLLDIYGLSGQVAANSTVPITDARPPDHD